MKQYIYETKCRRCGTISDWVFGDANRSEFNDFEKCMRDYIEEPRTFDCWDCKKVTVQDLVYYSQKEGE